MNVTLISSGLQLVQLGNGFARSIGITLPFCWAWGYWYGWCMSILYLALAMSIALPAVLPLAALFFTLTQAVHGANLRRGAFETFEMDRFFESRIAACMMQGTAFFWWTSAWYFMVQGSSIDSTTISLWAPTVAVMQSESSDESGGVQSVFNRTIISAIFGSFALLSWFASLYAVRGSLERMLFRRLGGQGPDKVVCLLGVLTIPLSLLALLWMPNLEWRSSRFDVPENKAIAILLFFLGLSVRLLACVTLFIQRRRTRVTSRIKLNRDKFLRYDKNDFVQDFRESNKDEDLTWDHLVQQRNWYRPPGRSQSGQHLQAQRVWRETTQLLNVYEESSGTDSSDESAA